MSGFQFFFSPNQEIISRFLPPESLGGSGEKRGGREWWEGDRREKDNGEKWGERKGWEDDIRGRDEVQRGEEGVGRGGRWK